MIADKMWRYTVHHRSERTKENKYKPVGDRDHKLLGMGSFGEYKLYGN
jgi:hypothetical protein